MAVLPAQPTVVTAEGASALGLPDCTVGEMFGGEISRVKHGGTRAVVEAPMPGALEWRRGGPRVSW